jgi:uncharacterized protein (TIGR00297 family)
VEVQSGRLQRSRSEIARKLVHVAFGFAAFALHWLTWEQALLFALAAVAHNLFILPRVMGKYIARHTRGWDVGIILYPVMVFLLILLFRDQESIAGAAWATLAFGDGFATIFGIVLGGPKLPWNRDKSWAGFAGFILAGVPAAYAALKFLGAPQTALPLLLVVVSAVTVAAVVESLSIGLDDNVSVATVSAAMIWWMSHWTNVDVPDVDGTKAIWLVINVALAIAGYFARSVNVSGLMGGILIGSVLILFGGWPAYLILLAFFILGTGTTKVGYRKKKAEGLAQEEGGRRGFTHAFANVGVAAICVASLVLTGWNDALLWIAATAALATAAADTVSSEIGQLLGKRTYLPLTFRPVARGTEGAVSIEGTVAGAVGGAIVAAIGIGLYRFVAADGVPPGFAKAWTVVALAAFAGMYLESVIGSFNRKLHNPISNGALNFVNTASGATIAAALARVTGVA